MTTEVARRWYARRKGLIEPIFGILKEQMGARRFLLRGLANVRAEFMMLATAFNLRVLWRAWKAHQPSVACHTLDDHIVNHAVTDRIFLLLGEPDAIAPRSHFQLTSPPPSFSDTLRRFETGSLPRLHHECWYWAQAILRFGTPIQYDHLDRCMPALWGHLIWILFWLEENAQVSYKAASRFYLHFSLRFIGLQFIEGTTKRSRL